MFHDKRIVLLTPICPVWSRLVPDRCEGSRRSTDGWVGCQEECELYPSFVLVCVFVCTCAYFQHPRLRACVFTSQPSCGVRQQKCWISVSCATLPSSRGAPWHASSWAAWATQTAAAMPSHNGSAKPWTSQEEVWYHGSRMSLALSPRRTDSNFRPSKSTDLSQFFSSSFHFFLRFINQLYSLVQLSKKN